VSLPLHQNVVLPCGCCGIPHGFLFTSQSDQVVCPACRNHAQDPEKRSVLHRERWMGYQAKRDEEHEEHLIRLRQELRARDAAIAELRQRVADLQAVVLGEYENAPLGDLQTFLQSEVVAGAESKMRAAYQSRGRAMAALWAIDRMHRDGKRPNFCECGVAVDKCSARKALPESIVNDLDRWERRELELLKRGVRHQLPEDHPEVVKRRPRYLPRR